MGFFLCPGPPSHSSALRVSKEAWLVPRQWGGQPPRCPAGIFRDTFPNVVELLDDLMKRAAEAAEPSERNYVRKHSLEMGQQGLETWPFEVMAIFPNFLNGLISGRC